MSLSDHADKAAQESSSPGGGGGLSTVVRSSCFLLLVAPGPFSLPCVFLALVDIESRAYQAGVPPLSCISYPHFTVYFETRSQ